MTFPMSATNVKLSGRRMTACLALVAGALASAQGQTALPLPIVTTLAGQPSGGSNVACGTSIPTGAGVSVPGDGCLAASATPAAPYGAQVDSFGNVYWGDYNNYALRVIYMGGATLAAAIQAANPTQTITPKVGYVYTLAGSRSAALASTQGATGGKMYYCNGAGSGIVGLGSNGDACPATYAYLKPRSIALDSSGDVFFTSASGGAPVRVVYMGGAQVAALIQTLFPGTTAQVGFVYSIVKSASNGYNGDGLLASNATVATYAPRDVALDSKGNIYMSDGTTFTGTAYASNNDIRVVNATTGIISTYAGSAGCAQGTTAGCPGVYGGDGGPATSATFNTPYTIFFDKYDNLYITEYQDARIRVVYKAGTVPGLSNLTPGNVYTVVGGGTLTASGSPATSLSLGTVYVGGIDSVGNLFFVDGTSKFLWRVDAVTGIATLLGGLHTTTKGVACNGSTAPVTGPVATDGFGSGCPTPQADITASGKLAFDKYGSFYWVESGNNLVRKASYNTLFPATAVGSSVSQFVAFDSTTAALTLTGTSFADDGGSTSEFSDGGGDSCALNASLAAGTVCAIDVKFTPQAAGARRGALSVATATSTAISYFPGGDGVAANTSVDPASTIALGSALTPNGVAADANGNVYIADTAGSRVVKVPSGGGTLTSLMTGLSKPAQVAVDGAGNVYVADTGNNRIAKTGAAGGTITSLGTGLSSPQGVAVDDQGNVYVADTGNNRVVQITSIGGQIAVNATGLAGPTRLAIDGNNDLFVVDSGNNRLVELPNASEQATVNLGATSTPISPTGVAVDAAGDLYVTDSVSASVVEFAAGSTNGNALVTGLTKPVDVAVDLNGSLYVADTSQTGVLAANRARPVTSFPNTNLNTSNSDPLNVTDTGNAALSFTGPTLTTGTGSTAVFAVTANSSNGCSTAATILPGSACGLTATFTPAAKGSFTETMSLLTNAANAANSGALLTGTGVFLEPTSTAIAVTSPTTATINYAQAVTVGITVTPTANVGAVPTGTVKITVDGKLQTQTLPASGVVTVTLNPAVGTHAVSASYGGDTSYASSSSSFSFTVLKAVTATTLGTSVGQSGAVPALTFTATVSSTTATGATGMVTFYAGTVAIGTATLNTGGVATFTTTATVYGTYSFTAAYPGDANFAASTSAIVAPKPDFTVVPGATAVIIPQGGVASLTSNITPLFNYSGTLTASCSGLPVNSVCRFSPVSLPLNGTAAQSFTVLVYTNVNPASAALEMPVRGGATPSARVFAARIMAWPLAALALLMLRRRRASRSRLLSLAAFALMLGGLGGCSSSTPANGGFLTPTGSSTVVVTYADGNGDSHTVSYSFTVNAAYPLP